ncbi:ribose-phosphate diphosphokinase [Streptomyces aidingensis]|uniref:Ribose-phosphate pyrophosphokinase n=1 Tax=Streptomyces aidingensis TaxID=910347 RepID=A0A1I1GTX6_9ACTN|nr:ribose-phosphate diphosphokinase [Streptomyces aidingensis]SFC14961.1 ribose-phosphate pyrophosphokinase [Streptomyces aidingensis]
MTGIKTTGQKKLMLFSGRAHPDLAKEVADELGVNLVPTTARDFANGEIYIRYQESVRGADCFLMQSHTVPVNKWIMEQLIMIDAMKRASARSISVVIPFYGYARQDKKHLGREPISARLMADLFKTAGADRIISVDLHADQVQGYFDGPVDHLFALPLLTGYIGGRVDRDRLTVVSPDAGRVRVADRWGDRLGAPLAIVHKRRDAKVANKVSVHEVVGTVRDRVCVLVDDMVDTGGTICAAAEALFANGAADVIVAATHGVLSDPAADRLKNSEVSEFVFTNSLPTPEQLQLDKITVLSLAPTIARAVREVFEDGSVTSLFEEHA